MRKLNAIVCCALLLNLAACGGSYDDDSGEQHQAPTAAAGGPAVHTFQIGGDAARPALRNKEGPAGPVRDTMIAVAEGDHVEIRPAGLTHEQRKVVPPAVSRQDNNVCVQTIQVCVFSIPIFERRCTCQPFPPLFPPPFCGPLICCNQSCQNIHVGDRCLISQPRCVRTQDQWIETSVFGGLDAPAMVADPTPMTSEPLMLTGLKLRFSFTDPNGSPQRVECPLGQFHPKADAEKFAFDLSNVDGCPAIFVSASKTAPTLSLVNGVSEPISYSQGSLVKTWDGRVLSQPQNATYLPAIDFAGQITVTASVGN